MRFKEFLQLEEGKSKHKVKKPRAEELNKVLRTKKGGAHFDKKKDYSRAKEKEKVRQEMNEGWMPHGDDRFSTEQSDIEQHIKDTNYKHRIRCPKCREQLHPKAFKPHEDREGDITHWTHAHNCGAMLTVFND